jgi:hypothetical protein
MNKNKAKVIRFKLVLKETKMSTKSGLVIQLLQFESLLELLLFNDFFKSYYVS